MNKENIIDLIIGEGEIIKAKTVIPRCCIKCQYHNEENETCEIIICEQVIEVLQNNDVLSYYDDLILMR